MANGGKVFLWCVGIGESNQVRSHKDSELHEKECEPENKKAKTTKVSSIELMKTLLRCTS